VLSIDSINESVGHTVWDITGFVSLDATVAEAVRVCGEKQLAVMIAKGIDRFPDNADRVSGHLDIWWIVRILPCATVLNCVPFIYLFIYSIFDVKKMDKALFHNRTNLILCQYFIGVLSELQ